MKRKSIFSVVFVLFCFLFLLSLSAAAQETYVYYAAGTTVDELLQTGAGTAVTDAKGVSLTKGTVKTGMKLVSSGTRVIVVYGDADGDGAITSADARWALRASVGLETGPAYSLAAADADENGKVEAADARLLLRVTVGLETLKPGSWEPGFDALRSFVMSDGSYDAGVYVLSVDNGDGSVSALTYTPSDNALMMNFVAYINEEQFFSVSLMLEGDGSAYEAYAMVMDDYGNIYLAGSFEVGANFARQTGSVVFGEYEGGAEYEEALADLSRTGTGVMLQTINGYLKTAGMDMTNLLGLIVK